MSAIKEYLKSIGVDSKTITALEKADDGYDVKPHVEEFNASQKKLFENDAELVSAITKKAEGRLYDMFTRKVKTTFGLAADQIKEKDWDEVVAIAKTESVKGMDKSIQDVQKELADATAKIKDYEEVQLPKIKGEVENEKKAFRIGNKLSKLIPHEDLRVPAETVELVLNNQLSSSYDLDLDESGEVSAFVKGKRLQPKSADGTKLLTVQDIVTDILKKNKFIKESNAEDGAGNPKPVKVATPEPTTPTGEKKILPPHLAAAQKHAEELKKQRENKAA